MHAGENALYSNCIRLIRVCSEITKFLNFSYVPKNIHTNGVTIPTLEFFLPKPLSADEINELIANAITESGAASMADMGKVMAVLKPLMQGKADMGAVSGQVRAALNAS